MIHIKLYICIQYVYLLKVFIVVIRVKVRARFDHFIRFILIQCM